MLSLEDIKLKINHNHIATNYHNEEDYDEIDMTVATVHFLKSENVKSNYDEVLCYNIINDEFGLNGDYSVCVESGYAEMDAFFNDIEFNFCTDVKIYNKDEVIGNVSFNRIFVEDVESLSIWVDSYAPNSMQISTQIGRKDFKNVEGRFIGIIDELVFNNDKYTNLAQYIIPMIYGFVYNLNCNLGLYYLYTQAKSANQSKYSIDEIDFNNLDAYITLGFKVVDEERNILRHNIWSENRERRKFDIKEFEEIYSP